MLYAGDADGLAALLTSPEGEALVPRSCENLPTTAARMGDTQCLRVFHERGFVLTDRTWAKAADRGHVSCLAFAVSRGYELGDGVLEKAVCNGHLACVQLLLRQGLPREPYLHFVYPARPDQLECIQLMLDEGVTISPQTLVVAAKYGDLGFVRWLHARGMPLWQHSQDSRSRTWASPLSNPKFPTELWLHDRRLWRRHLTSRPGTLSIPWDPRGLEGMWKTLRYGAGQGAPINGRARQILEERRRRTHAVLLCFKAAARLCQGPGCAKERRGWAGMAALPSALVEELLIFADLEIRESVMHRPPP